MTCFVILHYMTENETISSIESILNNVVGRKKIIVVDNGSSNDSGSYLIEKYKDNIDVDVIISKDNVGFAKGNNIGYRYAVTTYNPDFIVIINNDVEIYQKDFIKKISDIYQEERYAILSPDIYSTFSKVHQSPKRLTSLTYDEVKKNYKKFSFYDRSKIFIPIKCFIKECQTIKKFVQNLKFKSRNIDYEKIYYNVPIHGSCFIFSKDFINKRKNAFFEGTFMYYESEILDYECHRDNLKTMYNPDVKVNHHHSVSSAQSYKSELKRNRFLNKCMKDSLKSFLNIMEKDLVSKDEV